LTEEKRAEITNEHFDFAINARTTTLLSEAILTIQIDSLVESKI
jgi:hypothetical protein